jgi:cytochrome c oxidase subunit 2
VTRRLRARTQCRLRARTQWRLRARTQWRLRARTQRRRAVAAATVVLVGLALGACSGNSPSILGGKGSESRSIANVWWIMFSLAAAVYVVVAAFILFALFRGRRRAAGGDGAPAESRVSDTGFIVAGGIVVPTLILAVLAVVTVRTASELRRPDSQALRVDVVGKQWWWAVRYPTLGITTANEIHVPVGRPVEIGLQSDNVIHSFWVPQLAGKVDTIPGQRNHLRLEAREPGTYRGECAEYCGIQHANMSYLVIADEPGEFDRWLTRRGAGAGLTPVSEEAARGQVVFNRESCAGCHTVRGTQAMGTIGPDLSDFGARRSIGSMTIANSGAELSRWITDPGGVKPGTLMPPTALSPDDLAAVVAYLEGLK